MDITEKMAEAYWEAYRAGYYESGGKLDYPHWSASKDPVRNETYRCMRFAAQVLFDALPSQDNIEKLEQGWFDAHDAMKAILADLFPDPPMTREQTVELMAAKNAQLIDVMRDAASQT